MADRIAVINGGDLQQCAPPLECYEKPTNEFVATFIGSPSMNIFDGVVGRDAIEADHVTLRHSLGTEYDGDDVRVGVRPENAYLVSSDDEPASPSASFSAVVDVLEPVGDQTYAYLLPQSVSSDESPMGGESQQLLVSIDPATEIDEDETVEVVFDREKIHVFDGASGDAIAHSLVDPASAAGAVGSSEEAQGD